MKSLWKGSKRRGPDDAVEQEISFHIEEMTQANIARGMTPERARRQALVDFGGREQVRQSVREVHISRFIDSLVGNLKAAVRFIRKSPTFSLTVIVTLAIGIG